jgi:ABC-type transport system involved in multi-copper enzyme maturation permease subunit
VISGALVLKELRSGSRRWTTYLLRGLYVALAAVILWAFWEDHRHLLDSPSTYAQIGRDLFSAVNVLQITAAVLGAMLGCSDSITAEVRNGTLGIILMTPLTPFRVVTAKWGAVLVQTLTLLLSGAPALAICAYLGGVGPEDLLRSLAVCLVASGFGAALALHASSGAPSAARAFLTTLLRTFLLYLAWMIGFRVLVSLLPAVQLPSVLLAAVQYGFLVTMVLLIPLFLWLAARNTRRRVVTPEAWNVRAHAYATRPSYYSKHERGGKRLVIQAGVWEDRPMLWKDLATRSSARMSLGARIAVCVLIGVVVLFSILASDGQHPGPAYVAGFFLTILAVAQGSSLFAPENSGRRWDMLLTAPVSEFRIVGSKLAAGVLGAEALVLALLLLAPLGAYVLCGPGCAFFLGISGFLYFAFAYLLAAFLSLHSRTSRSAFLGAGLVVMLLLIVPPLFDSADLFASAFHPALLYEQAVVSPGDYHAPRTFMPASAFPYFLFQWSLFGGGAAVLWMLLGLRLRRVAASYA